LKLRDPLAAAEKVEELVREFELQKCINTYVGGQLLKGISGGEKKRLCVAIEMVSDPALIVLDEPTSGLDSNKAARLLTVLRRLASRGRTVIFTLHQSSYLQFAKLDRLLLLDKGRTIYQGAAAEIERYMCGLGLAVPTGNTISDFFMLEISQYRANGGQYSSPLNY
jgi:ABC-type multidrug transport system ATPase subunit